MSSASGSGQAVGHPGTPPLAGHPSQTTSFASKPRLPSSSSELSEASDSDVSSQGDDCQSRAKRLRVESSVLQQDASSLGSAAPAPASSSVERVEGGLGRYSEEAEAPPAALTAATMAERASSMFSLNAPAPVATGMPKVAKKATMELASLAFGATGKLCDQLESSPRPVPRPGVPWRSMGGSGWLRPRPKMVGGHVGACGWPSLAS